MVKVNCYAAFEAKGRLLPHKFDKPKLAPHEIEIAITHCGICHSDVHLIDGDWGEQEWPLIPGHEIVGTVAALGDEVAHLKKGDRVGVGWQAGSCHQCEWCSIGEEQHCSENQATCVGRPGGYAKSLFVDAGFAFPIPDALDSENAAPLLCGGITVYTPLRNYGIEPHMKVGVVGIGGLGHLAVQFAAAFGCEVTAFSRTRAKEQEAYGFGAHRFVATGEEGWADAENGMHDAILSTVSGDLDWSSFIKILRPKGKLICLGASQNSIGVNGIDLIVGGKSVCGSAIGGSKLIREMLEFSARHGIVAKTETVPMSEVNYAVDKTRRNEARYRMVLAN
ncbi:MAG: NAD(P)-dependent alcohol dehydrogenase [bacterium]|jgi:uncharacterized zinc-type alcohol dehydrogenase-like protein